MKKLEGLKFLQEHFPNLTVDCLYLDEEQDIDEKQLYIPGKEKEQIWRVRGGKDKGSELNLPQGTFKNPDEVREFIRIQRSMDPDLNFVIHRVLPNYFSPLFVGTIAVYNNSNLPGIRIELQRVTQELVDSIDKGKRPRDWETCLILQYDFLKKAPMILKKDNVDVEAIKYPLATIYDVGEKVFQFYDESGIATDSYTRFNIYDSGQVILDDHRSSESFIENNKSSTKQRRKQTTNRDNDLER